MESIDIPLTRGTSATFLAVIAINMGSQRPFPNLGPAGPAIVTEPGAGRPSVDLGDPRSSDTEVY